jgi:hypothetical protein
VPGKRMVIKLVEGLKNAEFAVRKSLHIQVKGIVEQLIRNFIV